MSKIRIEDPNEGIQIVNDTCNVMIRDINLPEEEVKEFLSMVLHISDWLVIVMDIDSIMEQFSEESKVILSVASENRAIQEGIKKHGVRGFEIKGTFAIHHYLDEDIRMNVFIYNGMQLVKYNVMHKDIEFGGSRITADKREIAEIISFMMEYWEKLIEMIRKDE